MSSSEREFSPAGRSPGVPFQDDRPGAYPTVVTKVRFGLSLVVAVLAIVLVVVVSIAFRASLVGLVALAATGVCGVLLVVAEASQSTGRSR